MVIPAGATRGTALLLVRRAFTAAGIEDAAQDARLLLLNALGIDGVELVARPDLSLAGPARMRVAAYASRRLAGEPVGRILGTREFWGLPFQLGPDTLEPRPDTETVVEAALRLVDRNRVHTLLDLGTGTGCLLVALLSQWPEAHGLGLDRSPAACQVARANAAANGVRARCSLVAGDWATALRGSFDVIVSNPPYIASPDVAVLPVEVARHDPLLALDGGPDGLDAYRRVLPECRRLLAPGGFAFLEIGQGQSEAVTEMGRRAGLELRGAAPDLSGVTRVLAFGSGAPTETSEAGAALPKEAEQQFAC